MNFSQLELLRLLPETQFNLSKAADKVNIVQSAASRHIQLLEEELGSPLLERHGKKILGFTPMGERVMKEIEGIDLAKRNIQTIADDYQANRNGALHIATTHTQAKYLLPEPIRKFREQFPGVTIYMVQSSPGEIIDLLYRHEADIAICTEKMEDSEKLVIKPCYEWNHVAIVPQGHPLADAKLTLEKLASYPLLTYSPGYTGRSNIEKAFAKHGLELDITLSAADSDVIKTYVRLGLGVGIISGASYEPGNDSDLICIDLAHLIPRSMTKLAYLKQLYLPTYLRCFIGELLNAGSGRATS
ncbi:LysR substrate-binding domain-containing protein [Methylomonas koyamae]|uniref:LysR substrate-binding domain-containing protein n=1 Tax=Methylomonas koyamae TaxID=702114 RepID=UPI00112D00EA|nr:LysR substrate-binding domain-containing protein [Methylomonas koyamae]TPQ26005.1 LysR family transcriptional regulator [Methylomonas koyamae]